MRVTDVRYHFSQPWPFPSSLMIGFTARALDDALRRDPDEIDDVRWFTREEIRDGIGAGSLALPAPISIARHLIEDWLAA